MVCDRLLMYFFNIYTGVLKNKAWVHSYDSLDAAGNHSITYLVIVVLAMVCA